MATAIRVPQFREYDYKLQKDERTFAQNLLHAAALDFVLIRRVCGSNLGPDVGEGDNPSRDVFKTKADVVKFVQEAVADGAQVIQQQGDAGLDKTSKFFGNPLAHNSTIWTFAIEHSGEHYGQLVVYYRANNLVPPDTRGNQAQESQRPAAPRIVDLRASDGTVLKASYFAAAKPGPGVLLLHQVNCVSFREFFTDHGFRRSDARPDDPGLRCCPSSLDTFPADFSQDLARDCHINEVPRR